MAESPATAGRNGDLLLGFDYGERRIGVAVGEAITGSARPLACVANRENGPDWTHIDSLVKEWRPQVAVVGLPTLADGGAHRLTPKVQAFCEQLRKRYALTVHGINEGYSSEEARTQLKESRRAGRRGRVQREDIDPLAAALVLQGYLESLRSAHRHAS